MGGSSGSITLVTDQVIAEIKGIHYSWHLNKEKPPGSVHFGVWVMAFIGTVDDDGADSFDVLVCSPSWLADRAAAGDWEIFSSQALAGMSENVVPGAGIWLMRTWSPADFESALEIVVEKRSPGPDWETVAARIGRSIPWEFAYQHDEVVNREHGLPSPWRM